MNKHTPGPWEYGEQEGEYVIWNPDIGTIATTCADMADQEANAALLASAPEMLEALQYVVKWHREHDSGEGELFGLDYVTTCISAIRKTEVTK